MILHRSLTDTTWNVKNTLVYVNINNDQINVVEV